MDTPAPRNPASHQIKQRPRLGPEDFGPHWNTAYYEIIQEYYWDPKLIGRVPANPPVFANDKEMFGSLRRAEVSLNHLLALFFSLAPQDYIAALEKFLFGDSSQQRYRNIGILELRRTSPNDPTQPDVFLASESSCFSIEVKIGAKSSLEQVVKYALLHCDYQQRSGSQKSSRLTYLTPNVIDKTWIEKFPDLDAVTSALDLFDYDSFLKKTRTPSVSAKTLKSAALSLQVSHTTFDQFHNFTKIYAQGIPSDAPFSDSVTKLFDGLLHELDFRRDLIKLSSTSSIS